MPTSDPDPALHLDEEHVLRPGKVEPELPVGDGLELGYGLREVGPRNLLRELGFKVA